MSNKYFNFSDVLGYGWRVMKANLWFFVGLGFLYIIIIYLPGIAEIVVRKLQLPPAYQTTAVILLNVLGQIIGLCLTIGLIKIALKFCDEQKPKISMLFDFSDCFWRYLGATILYVLIFLGGILLLIVPGIIWSIKFALYPYFVIDKGLGPIDALKASSRTTLGAKWQLFGFIVLCIVINTIGLLCLIVGIFATYPMAMVAQALVYRQLSAQTPELAEFGIGQAAVQSAPEPSI